LQPAARLVPLVAALHGAAGVAVAASAAHIEHSDNLATASQFLMIHAAAGLGLAALAQTRPGARGPIVVGLAMQAGVTLFAGDLCARGFGYGRLFPMAAPIGGSLTLLAWLALAGVFAAAFFTRPPPPQSR